MVVKSEVTARKIDALDYEILRSHREFDEPGNDVDAALLKAGPASLLDIGGSLGKFIGGELASPVGLHSFLNLTVCTYGNAEREMNNIDGDQ